MITNQEKFEVYIFIFAFYKEREKKWNKKKKMVFTKKLKN